MDSRVDLPQPDGTGDGDVLAAVDLQVDAGEGVGLDLVGLEDLGQVLQMDQRIGHGLLPRLAGLRPTRCGCGPPSPSAGVGEDDLVPGRQPLEDLHRGRRRRGPASPEPARRARRPSRAGRGSTGPPPRPCAAGPPERTSVRRSISIVPSTVRSGRAPRGSGPSSATSTVTVPFCAAGSTRATRPGDDPVAGVDGRGLAEQRGPGPGSPARGSPP